jgi:hypothetical protein
LSRDVLATYAIGYRGDGRARRGKFRGLRRGGALSR